MKANRKNLLHLIAMGIFVVFIMACSNADSSIQADIDSNPKLKQKNITAKIVASNNGYYSILVKGLGSGAIDAINKGQDLGSIAMLTTMDVIPLIEMEQILRKRAEVKGVVWKAE